jgi:hypothetical protein
MTLSKLISKLEAKRLIHGGDIKVSACDNGPVLAVTYYAPLPDETEYLRIEA